MKQHPKAASALAALSAALLLLAGCGGDTPDPGDSSTQAPPPASTSEAPPDSTGGVPPIPADLAAAAEAEGQVVIYSSMTTAMLDNLTADFQAAYPKIKMEYLKDSSAGISERLMSEQAAGHYVADVYMAWWDTVARITEAGHFASYVPDQASAYDPELIDPNGHWMVAGFDPTILGYNTQALSGGDVPHSWTAMWDPKHSGQVGIYDPRIGGGAYNFFYGMWKLFGDEFVQKVAANNPMMLDASAAIASSVGSSQVVLSGMGYTGWSPFLADAPIAMSVPDEGMPVNYMMSAVVETAPHPNAARLFKSWLMSEGGQLALSQNVSSFYAALDSVPPPAGLPPLSEVKVVPTDFDEYLEVREAVTEAACQALGCE
jgi:iron(III) transport system substrate-binding protein